MKIRKVKWLDHPILGNLELDFTNSTTGQPYESILFAGENGTGKTTILETISTFLNRGSFEYFDFIEYIAEGKVLKAVPANGATIKDFYDMINEVGQVIQMRTNQNNHNKDVDENPLNIRFSGCVFSKARADFKTEAIKSTSTKQLDESKYDKDNEDNFTSLKQLIVDLDSQDNSEFAKIARSSSTKSANWDSFQPHSKLYRFKKAFDHFFDKLKYDKVEDTGGEKSILFVKNGKSIPIDKLSTGEKQIVFRGAYLLKNLNKLNGSAVMVDEPELSMHPKWQEKILQYYKNLFTESTVQKTQLFFATHSEHVLKEALSNKNSNLVFVLNENAGIISAKRIDAPMVLPSITNAETNYIAFDIVSNDYHIELYGYLQQKESKDTVKLCDDYIVSHVDYDGSKHQKSSLHPNCRTTYNTLPTYIRNAIDHPSSTVTFTDGDLRTSTELLIKLCQ